MSVIVPIIPLPIIARKYNNIQLIWQFLFQGGMFSFHQLLFGSAWAYWRFSINSRNNTSYIMTKTPLFDAFSLCLDLFSLRVLI